MKEHLIPDLEGKTITRASLQQKPHPIVTLEFSDGSSAHITPYTGFFANKTYLKVRHKTCNNEDLT
jgi:hypothetical protein